MVKGLDPWGAQAPDLTAEYTEYADPSRMVTGADAPATGLETKPEATVVGLLQYERSSANSPSRRSECHRQLVRADWNPQRESAREPRGLLPSNPRVPR